MKATEHSAFTARKPAFQDLPHKFWDRGDLVVLSVSGAIIAIAILVLCVTYPGKASNQDCPFASSIVSTCN